MHATSPVPTQWVEGAMIPVRPCSSLSVVGHAETTGFVCHSTVSFAGSESSALLQRGRRDDGKAGELWRNCISNFRDLKKTLAVRKIY